MKRATRYLEYRPRLINGKRVASGEYRSWQMAKNRCHNPKGKDYQHYSSRGITVCDRWRDSFDNFMDDMGPKPFPEASLERKDGTLGYCPENCIWADRTTQARNRSNVVCIRGFKTWELAEQCGVQLMTIHHRLWKAKQGHFPMGRVFAVEQKNQACSRRRYL